LPGQSAALDLGDDAIGLHVEAKLPHVVPPQRQLLRDAAGSHTPQSKHNFAKLAVQPVYPALPHVHPCALALVVVQPQAAQRYWSKDQHLGLLELGQRVRMWG